MPATQFYINFRGKEEAFINAESIMDFLLKKENSEILANNHFEIDYKHSAKLSCDINEGKIKYNNVMKISPYVTNTFFFDNQMGIINSIKSVMGLIAKLNLVEKLREIEPRLREQFKIDNLFVPKDNLNDRYNKVNNMLKQIMNVCSRKETGMQTIIYENLKKVEIDKIESKKSVEQLITSIQNPNQELTQTRTMQR